MEDNLIIGIDLKDKCSQVCVYDWESGMPKSLQFTDSDYEINSELELEKSDEKNFSNHIYDVICSVQEKSNVSYLPKVCITIRKFEKEKIKKISEAMKILSYPDDRWMIISYEECFAYFAFNQKKELFQNGVMLFDLNENELDTTYMTLMEKNNCVFIPQGSETFTSEDLKECAQGIKNLKDIEDEIIDCFRKTLQDRIISTLYLTGRGFDTEDFPDRLTKTLCQGRKVFAGQNIYVKGACFAALEELDDSKKGFFKNENVILACKNRVTTSVETEILSHGEKKRFRMVRMGSNWYMAKRKMEFILNDITNIPLILKQCGNNEESSVDIDISKMPYREPKMTRISLEIFFEDDSDAIVKITDLGFGQFAESSNIVIEKKIEL